MVQNHVTTMANTLPQTHGIMLLKYAGISFISGAVNHGFFSGSRSLWTAGVGMVLFVTGAWLEHARRGPEDGDTQGLLATLLWGALLSVGLGFFTGGLQHFPDSPARSAWVVPLGFAVSVVALSVSTSTRWTRATGQYAIVTGLAVGAFSWGAYQWLLVNPQWADGGGHSHAAPNGLVAQTVTRSVTVHMDDSMRFMPDHVDVRPGEVIRFVVHNGGAVPHEFVLGDAQAIATHAEQMRQAAGQAAAPGHSHAGGAGAALSVAAGQMGEMVVGFSEPATLQIACLVPGHYEAGMRGTLSVQVASASPAVTGGMAGGAEHQH